MLRQITFNTIDNNQVRIVLSEEEVNMCDNLSNQHITCKEIVNNHVIDLLVQYITTWSNSHYWYTNRYITHTNEVNNIFVIEQKNFDLFNDQSSDDLISLYKIALELGIYPLTITISKVLKKREFNC